jgi:hypothetical protein
LLANEGRGGGGYVVRFGKGPESAEALAADAAAAEAKSFPHGVSTKFQERAAAGAKHRVAPREIVERYKVAIWRTMPFIYRNQLRKRSPISSILFLWQGNNMIAEPKQLCLSLPPIHDRFNREVILDWYDGPIQAVVECARCCSWFFAWLVAWDPGHPLRVYAFRRIPMDWTKRLFEVLGEPSSTSIWPVKLDAGSRRRLHSLVDALFGEPASDLYVSAAGDFSEAGVSFRAVDSHILGEWARPAAVESIVNQADDERERLRRLVQA